MKQKRNARVRKPAALAALLAAGMILAGMTSTAEELPADPAAELLEEAPVQEEVSGEDVQAQADPDEGSDFAESWDDILLEPEYDEWEEDWQEEEPAADPEEAQAAENVAAAEEAAEAEQNVSADVVLPEGTDGTAVGGLMDGMDTTPSAEELSEMAQERAMAFLEAPYTILEQADPERITLLLDELTWMPSPTGSDGELEIGQYIMDEMEKLGYHVTTQNFHEDFLNEDLVDVPGMNILAEREVNDVNPTDDVLLVITHYDSKTSPEEDDPLANDKTGVAAVMEAARLVAGEKTVTDVCFVFLSGEEDGFYGSRSFVESIAPFLEKVIGVIHVGPNGYVQTLTIPVDETKKEEIRTVFPTAAGTADGEDNRPANLLLTSAAVQKLSLLSGIDGEEGTDPAGNEAIKSGRLDWTMDKDAESSCSAFREKGLETVTVRQKFSGVSAAGQDRENIRIEPDAEAVAENADILARTIGMYMAGVR